MTARAGRTRSRLSGRRRVLAATFLLLAVATACSDEPLPAPKLLGPVDVVFDDPNGVLRPYEAGIRATLDSALAMVRAELPVTGVTITVGSDASRTIAGYGAGGYTPDAARVLLHLDLSFPNLADVLHRRLMLLAAHELHHAIRWRDPGYGSTLFEAMVSEGLADRFALEVMGGEAPPWTNAFPEDSTAHYLNLAQSEFDSGTYDHARWFFGTDPPLPRWTGYTLGHRLVEAYQASHPGVTAAQLVDESAASFRP